MESSRQAAFRKLRPVCVELSSVGLKFRGRQATSTDVLRALEPVYNILDDCSKQDVLDEKLAEYAFFPLTNIFNETQRVSARCLEVAVKCLTILVAQGWRQHLSPQMGKQLIILMTLIVGGTPAQKESDSAWNLQPDELAEAGYGCLEAIFQALHGSVAERTIFHEIGTATIIDQTVYVLLEGVADERSDATCVAAAKALQALLLRVTDRLVLASIMPRTVSALTRVISPTTQVRRSYRLLEICFDVLTQVLRSVLSDNVAAALSQKAAQPVGSSERPMLDASWLNATAIQIKLALSNVVQIRRHERLEVQTALLRLCLMVLKECTKTLKEALPIMLETVVALSETGEASGSNEAYSKLKTLATTDPHIVDLLRESLYTWITSLPRVMQNNDETAKQRAVRQVSVAFQILSEVDAGSDILTAGLASGLCDSLAASLTSVSSDIQLWDVSRENTLDLSLTEMKSGSMMFPPVLLDSRSQQRTLKDLQSMINKLSSSESGEAITRSMINRLHNTTGPSIISPFWLSLNFLRASAAGSEGLDDFISLEQFDSSQVSTTRADMIEELYYISLRMLRDAGAESGDWRALALALEAVALQAQQLGKAFRPELMDALYPTLQLLASGHGQLQRHAMTCLNILTAACNYTDISSMIIENVDYLTNSVSLRLNMFDVSPYQSQILLMMVRLCGAKLIPYLDDLVDSLFGIVDMYHGYPRLVEIMFTTLAAIVEEGTKNPSLLAITDGKDILDPSRHRKRPYRSLPLSTVAEDFVSWRSKRSRFSDGRIEDSSEEFSHPRKPWADDAEESEPSPEGDSLSNMLEKENPEEPLPPPREPDDTEKPLSKSHKLLLHIVKAICPHLSSPSPYLRRSLLSILVQVIPTLSVNDNSFLPLINEVWPAVASRITLPASARTESSASALLGNDTSASTSLAKRAGTDTDSGNFHEETFVVVAACQAIQAMCEGAGDFMASRVEADFPRWERLYRKVWEKVRHDADRAIERRARQRSKPSSSPQTGQSGPDAPRVIAREADATASAEFLPTLSLNIAPSSSLITRDGATIEPSASFTSHHNLWRALTLLFITLLTHVRLPLAAGDQICEFLAAWIVGYAGPEYYFCNLHRRQQQPQQQQENGNNNGVTSTAEPLKASAPAQTASIKTIEDAIQAMDTWNADLTWFLFQQERQARNKGKTDARNEDNSDKRRQEPTLKGHALSGSSSTSTSPAVKLTESLHKHVRFAEIVF